MIDKITATTTEFNIENKEFEYCVRCGRRLKSEINRLRGMGDICWKKSQTKKRSKLF